MPRQEADRSPPEPSARDGGACPETGGVVSSSSSQFFDAAELVPVRAQGSLCR